MVDTEAQHSSVSTITSHLIQWSWFRALPEHLRALVLRSTLLRTVSAGEYIARAGEPCSYWYGLLRGFLQMYVVRADGVETTLSCVRENQWCGDGSLLKNELRRYDLRSLTPCELVMVPAETFEALRQSSIEFNQFLCEVMNERMGGFVDMLEAARLLGPELRVARGLLMLASGGGGEAQELPIPQHELALICGLSRQRVNMSISAFRRCGLVRQEFHRGMLLVNVPKLRAYVTESDYSCADSESRSESMASLSPPQKSSCS